MRSTLDALGQQHQEVLAQLAAIEDRLERDERADLSDFLLFLRGDVAAHFTVEERALFPVMARHLSLSSGPLAVMNAEHDSFRELVEGLGSAIQSADTGRQQVCARDIIELLREHIAKEDHVLLPMAGRLLSAVEQQEVDSRAGEVRAAS